METICVFAPVALLAILALVLDPHPVRMSRAEMRALRMRRFEPNRLSLSSLRQTCAQIGLVVAVHVHEFFSG